MYQEIDAGGTLKAALAGKTVIEYPTILVGPPGHMEALPFFIAEARVEGREQDVEGGGEEEEEGEGGAGESRSMELTVDGDVVDEKEEEEEEEEEVPTCHSLFNYLSLTLYSPVTHYYPRRRRGRRTSWRP